MAVLVAGEDLLVVQRAREARADNIRHDNRQEIRDEEVGVARALATENQRFRFRGKRAGILQSGTQVTGEADGRIRASADLEDDDNERNVGVEHAREPRCTPNEGVGSRRNHLSFLLAPQRPHDVLRAKSEH